MNALKRIIASPFVLGIMLTVGLYYIFERWIAFIRYGGEFINYTKGQPKTVQDVYMMIENEIMKKK